MVNIGKWNRLTIEREIVHGLILDGEDEGDILMPTKFVPPKWEIGEEVYVFVYPDSEDRLVATTEYPLAQAGQFAFLECAQVNKTGAFLKMGLPKDLLVPYREQQNRMYEGESYVVRVYLDKVSGRLVGTTNLFKWLDRGAIKFDENQEVELIIIEETEIGYKAIINQVDVGLLYSSEVFQDLNIGDIVKGYIVETRPDGKIDLSLHKPAEEKVDDLTDRILKELENNDGTLNLHDKSDPEDIYDTFQSSKKTFKRAISSLYKQKRIRLHTDHIELVSEE